MISAQITGEDVGDFPVLPIVIPGRLTLDQIKSNQIIYFLITVRRFTMYGQGYFKKQKKGDRRSRQRCYGHNSSIIFISI